MILETNHKSVIEYIRMRGHASYSSLKMLRDGGTPGVYKKALHFDIGTELHARWLEKQKPKKFDKPVEEVISGMYSSLNRDKVATILLKGAQVEYEFTQPLYGVTVHGFVDILPPKVLIGDLKTTALNSRSSFIGSMDFLQAALYLNVMARKDFYYIGVSKVKPYQVFTFRVSDYPARLKQAQGELKELLTYVKTKL